GKTWVAVANADKDHPYRLSLDLGGARFAHVSGRMLTAAHLDAHNTPGLPEEIAPQPYRGGQVAGGRLLLDIPAKAIVVVALD
ncbi:MAG TPA: alpha-N-arabinofuranosidase, partial [Novosphingobium sp.]|nr:alpha-N-arabinofuranosidase [Novosphingobium sp.]